MDLGGGPLTGVNGADIFVVKFEPSGNHLWSKRFGDANGQYAHSLAIDSIGNVVITSSSPNP